LPKLSAEWQRGVSGSQREAWTVSPARLDRVWAQAIAENGEDRSGAPFAQTRTLKPETRSLRCESCDELDHCEIDARKALLASG
jgi:hypothetical protein